MGARCRAFSANLTCVGGKGHRLPQELAARAICDHESFRSRQQDHGGHTSITVFLSERFKELIGNVGGFGAEHLHKAIGVRLVGRPARFVIKVFSGSTSALSARFKSPSAWASP